MSYVFVLEIRKIVCYANVHVSSDAFLGGLLRWLTAQPYFLFWVCWPFKFNYRSKRDWHDLWGTEDCWTGLHYVCIANFCVVLDRIGKSKKPFGLFSATCPAREISYSGDKAGSGKKSPQSKGNFGFPLIFAFWCLWSPRQIEGLNLPSSDTVSKKHCTTIGM